MLLKTPLVAAILTAVFFGVSSLFVKFGPCGPADGASAVFFIILLPAVLAAGKFGASSPFVGWAAMIGWVFLLSWSTTGIVRAAFQRIRAGRYETKVNAIVSTDLSPDRAATLRVIAAKTGLSERDQICIVEALKATAGFSGRKKEILMSLLENQSVTPAVRKQISNSLPALDLIDADARMVASALAK